MSVTVDRLPLATEEMGLQTLGQLIAHLQKDNRLVVHVLVDGEEPDLSQMGRFARSRWTSIRCLSKRPTRGNWQSRR